MKVRKIEEPTRLVIKYEIEIPQIEAVRHKASHFEKMTLRTYEVTHKISDFFFWMSEYARTEEESLKKKKEKK